MVFNNTEWQEYLELTTNITVTKQNMNERNKAIEKAWEWCFSHLWNWYRRIVRNEEIEMYLKEFMLNLNPIQRRRFKMYFIDNLTYRQIADIESRNIKSIYESVQAGKKKFLKYLDKHPNKNTPTSLSLWKDILSYN